VAGAMLEEVNGILIPKRGLDIPKLVQRELGPLPDADKLGMSGHVGWALFDENGEIRNLGAALNLITQIGDQYYGERASGIASPPAQVTGMRLGTGTTAAAKTGAGAAIVTYITASQVGIDATYPQSSLVGANRQIRWQSTWGAGVATNAAIAEAVISNENPITNVAGTAANTIARVYFGAGNTVNKAAGDTLVITWDHNLQAA
jgi:hypothetical protein